MKHSLSLVLLFTIFFSNCTKSFLDVKENAQLFKQNYIKDVQTLRGYTYGILQEFAAAFEYGKGSGYDEIIADNLKPANSGMGLFAHYNWQQIPDPKDLQPYLGADDEVKSSNPLWGTGYRLIRNSSFVLEESSKYSSENPELVNNLKGQALAMRAYLHFRICSVFAQHYSFTVNGTHPGIPYITSSDITVIFPRLTVGEVYQKIIEDLEEAQTLLPSTFNDTRVFNRESAKALMARVYLFKEDYAKAQQYATEVIANHPLMQVGQGYPAGLFKFDPNMTNGENLMQISPQGGSSPGRTALLGIYLKRARTVLWNATADIGSMLVEDPADVRSAWVQNVNDTFYVTKFPENAAPGVSPAPFQPEGAYYQPVIRSSELYLAIAECAAKTGDETTAQDYLNAIRQRANPAAPIITPTGTALVDSIYKERRKELCFEGLRMPDLQRWKLGVHRIDALAGSPKDLPYPSDKAIAPIPLTDVTLGGIPQNAGY